MSNRPSDRIDSLAAGSNHGAQDPEQCLGLYDELCKFENLELAYTQLAREHPDPNSIVLAREMIERQGAERFLLQLSEDLLAHRYQPVHFSPQLDDLCGTAVQQIAALRDAVVRAAIVRLLDRVFAPELPFDPDADKAIRWIGGAIESGLTRVHALTIQPEWGTQQRRYLIENARYRIGDRPMLSLLEKFLAAVAKNQSPTESFAFSLANVVYSRIDHILEETKMIGREGTASHVKCARLGNEIVILVDPDPRYDWVLPAVQKRIRGALADLQFSLDHDKTQSVDLALGDRLRFLGYELRRARNRSGTPRTIYKRIAPRPGAERPAVLRYFRLVWLIHPFQLARSCFNRGGNKALAHPKRGKRTRLASAPGSDKAADPATDALESDAPDLPWPGPGVRHPSFTLTSRLPRLVELIEETCHQAGSIQVTWRQLPLPLYPALALVLGWHSWPAWLCLALLAAFNWRAFMPLLRHARRRWAEVALAMCVLGTVAVTYPVVSDLYGRLPMERAAPDMPAGFYLGQYSWSWDADPLQYGLYVPPQFRSQQGPFPLVVYLHGYSERFPDRILVKGLPRSIVRAFGDDKPNGPFGFVAFFPIDPTGEWQTGSAEVEGVLRTLHHIIRRHHIDPARVYLTGISTGGSGVWGLAEADPQKWAALAALSAPYCPDVRAVRHIPARIYVGARDTQALVDGQRRLARDLRQAGADVAYAEVEGKGHDIWAEVYSSRELFDWLAQKRKD